MTPDAASSERGADRRERVVSATAFAAAAALFGLVGLVATMAPADLWRYETKALVLGPPVMAISAALVGWRAGPHLAQSRASASRSGPSCCTLPPHASSYGRRACSAVRI